MLKILLSQLLFSMAVLFIIMRKKNIIHACLAMDKPIVLRHVYLNLMLSHAAPCIASSKGVVKHEH